MPSGVSQASAAGRPAASAMPVSALTVAAEALAPSNGTFVKSGIRRIAHCLLRWSSHPAAIRNLVKSRVQRKSQGTASHAAQAPLRPASSAQIHATVDVNDLPGEVALFGLREKQRRGGNLIHVTLARHRRGAVP